jgi:coenzyme F420-reducing hydrogenase gamma subunit
MKPRIAFFDFASCEGCQLQVANLEETLLDVLHLVDVVSFREVMKEHSDDYDIAVVEGSIARPMDEERVRAIRDRAKLLIALGACAHLGGVQRLGNRWTPEQNKRAVYDGADGNDIGDNNPFFEKPRHRALDEVVKVDVVVPGCPVSRDELARVLVALLTGRRPPIPDYPLCVECKKKENGCLFTVGKVCMGPVTRAGCGAACPTFGNECEACRGFISHPHADAQVDVLRKHGLTPEEILSRRTLFTTRHLEQQGKVS